MRSLWILAALAACGGSDTVSIDKFTDAVNEAHCQRLVRCGEMESVEQCRKLKVDRPSLLNVNQREAVAQGKLRFSETRAESCISAFADQSCDTTSKSGRRTPSACGEIFSGVLHAEDACAFDGECISQVCRVPSCPDACCVGRCIGDTAPGHAKLGESCENATCDADSYCDDATLMCTALKPSGAFCGSPAECQYGFDCDRGGQCTSLPTLGQSCTEACRDEGTTCGTAGTCVKVGLAGDDCTATPCARPYRCIAKQCVAGAALGAPCGGGQLCADDRAFCDTPAGEPMGKCALRKADGEPCQTGEVCDSLYCDPATQVCAPEPACI